MRKNININKPITVGPSCIKDARLADALTHGGVFHADEVFATACLNLAGKATFIIRAFSVPEDFDGIVYDIGGGQYDHHDKKILKFREDGLTPYSSFGLIWKDYGKEAIRSIINDDDADDIFMDKLVNIVHKDVDRVLVTPIDAVDNGIVNEGNNTFTISKVISGFNPSWNEEGVDLANGRFEEAVNMAKDVLFNTIKNVLNNTLSVELLKEMLCKNDNNIEVVIMDQFVPFRRQILDWSFADDDDELNKLARKVKFVIHPSNRGGYMIQALPAENKEITQQYRCDFLTNGQEMPGVTFIHPNGFCASAKSIEDAKALAFASLAASKGGE